MVKPFVTVCVAALISSASAVTLSTRDEAARDGAIQWLQLVDAGHYDEAASQASLEARALEQWLNHFKAERRPLGRVNRREFVEVKHISVFPRVPDVRRYYVLRFRTSFDNRPVAIEQITICKMGCCWEIYEYKISDK